MICKEFAEIVEGRSVALIGGAKGANERRAAEAEIVARCNLYINDGQRCDMAFLAGNAPEKMPIGLKTACVNVQSPKCIEALGKWDTTGVKVFGFFNTVYSGASPHGADNEWLNMFGHQLGSMPLCGILAARYLTLHNIRSLYVTGMDFYIDEVENVTDVKGRKVWMRGPHELGAQLDWLVSLEVMDQRVVLDACVHGVKARAIELGLK